MKHVLRAWFGRQVHWHFFDEARNKMPRRYQPRLWDRVWPHQTGRGVCIYGPFNRERGFGVEDYYPSAGQCFAMVRDPLSTICSRYFYAKQQGLQRMHAGRPAPLAEQFGSLDAFVEHHLERPYFIHYLPGPMTMNTYRSIIETRFVYVGIAEEMQMSLDHLAARLGFASVPAPHVNTSRHDETLDPALAAAFERSRPLEYAIYHYALEHYRDEPVT